MSPVSSPSGAVTGSASGPPLPRFARTAVGAIAGAVAVLLLVTSAFGGYQFDELYFIAAGEHMAWGYADQPWLVPLLATTLDTLFPGSLLALRLPSTVAGVAGVLVTALIARELGGRRTAQVLAAATYSVAWGLMAVHHLLATTALDPLCWLGTTALVIRWVRLRQHGLHHDRLLLAAGAIAAVALQIKFLIPLLWLALMISVLLVGPREVPRRPRLWAGAGIAVAATVPTLVWQHTHGWPYLEFTQVVGRESRRLDLLTSLPLLTGVIGLAMLGYALWHLFRSPRWRPYRFLGCTFLGVMALLVLLDGRAYYPIGIYGALFAVAAVELEHQGPTRWRAWVAGPAYTLSAAATVAILGLTTATTGQLTTRATVQPVAQAYHALPSGLRADTAIVTAIYPTAATLHHYADELDLPRVYSHHRGYYYLGRPPPTADTVLYVNPDGPAALRDYFAHARQLGNSQSGVYSGIWLLEGRTRPWSTIWPRIQSGLTTN